MSKKIFIDKPLKSAGFSLTEVMIAVLIFTFCLLALAKFTGGLFTTNSSSFQRTEALDAARRKLADMESFAKISTTSGYTAYNDIVSGNDTVTGANTTYTRTWTVSTDTTVGYKTIVVTVTWTTQEGASKTLRLTSLIGKNDPSVSAQAPTGSSGAITP